MKRNNKEGFTVVEMMAVIVILLIIIIITVPVVGNIIETVKREAFRATAHSIADAGRFLVANENEAQGYQEFYYLDGIEYNADGRKLDYSGKGPKTGAVVINEKNKIVLAIHNGTYCATKSANTNKVTVTKTAPDDCNAYSIIETCDTWEQIALKYDVSIVDLLAANDETDSSTSTCNRDIKIPVSSNSSGSSYASGSSGPKIYYKTYYTVGYVSSSSTLPLSYQYTIKLGVLPLNIADIEVTRVTDQSVFETLDDFKRYITKKNMGEVIWQGEDATPIDIIQASVFRDHAADSTNMTADDVTVSCDTEACYATVSATVDNLNNVNPNTIGENLVAYTPIKFTVEFNGEEEVTDNSGASEPELANNMIPIMYYNGNWVKADKDNLVGTYSWYDYATKKWANAVTVTPSTLDTYKKANIGAIVNEVDILTYLVWIPRYKYAIPAGAGARSINIVFENSLTTKSSGTAIDTNYLTHPAFTFGEKELNGLWVGKFETTGTTSAITIKPDLASVRSQTVSALYTSIENMKSSGNSYSFSSSEVDTHMMKNDEWGAVAYLSMSTYGLNSEIYKNNSSSYYTGRSGGNVGGSQIKPDGTNEYIDTGFYTYDGKCATTTITGAGIDANCTAVGNTLSDIWLSYNASTTGNIYGVYDMSGGAWEYVMGNYNNYSGHSSTYNSGFNGPNGYNSTTVTTGLNFPSSKYYNLYTTTDATTACNGGICHGQALSETSGWHGDVTNMISASYPWLLRGGYYGGTASAGAFSFNGGGGGAGSDGSARVSVVLGN